MSTTEDSRDGANEEMAIESDGKADPNAELSREGESGGAVAATAAPKAHLGRGIALSLQLKQVILNLKKYFETKNQNWNLSDVSYEVFLATRVSETSIRKVFSEFKRNQCLSEPKTSRNRPKKYSFTQSDKQTIDSIIFDFYSEDRAPELNDLYNAIKSNDKISFKDCSKSYFYRLFKQMGYKVNKTKNKHLIERPDITAKREENKKRKKLMSQKSKQNV